MLIDRRVRGRSLAFASDLHRRGQIAAGGAEAGAKIWPAPHTSAQAVT